VFADAIFWLLFALLFEPEDGGNVFLRNFNELPQNYIAETVLFIVPQIQFSLIFFHNLDLADRLFNDTISAK
jgi:hypothetical protein